MVSIDLIPESYRGIVRARRILRLLAAILVSMAVVVVVVLAGVHWQLDHENQRLALLRQEASRIAALRQQNDALKEQKERFERAAEALAALRGEGEAGLAVQAMDQSLNEGVWLSSFRFQRTYQLAQRKEQEQQDGRKIAIVFVSSNQANEQKEQTWLFSTHLEIKGTAIDHAALGEFMGNMSRQRRVMDVRFLNSHLNDEASGQVVEFGAEVYLQAKGKQL